MSIKDAWVRCAEKIAYRHWEMHKYLTAEENWQYALKVIKYIDKRIELVKKLVTKGK